MIVIQLKNITKIYKVGEVDLPVLKGITLDVHAGDFVAIMGPSGSGKSTLMQIMGLLDRPTSGTYHLLQKDVSNLSDDEGARLRSDTIGFIFQMFNLLARTTAIDNVALPMVYSGVADRTGRSKDLLKMVGLGDRMFHKPNQLSGGQQQRIAIARALVNQPQILFADEPTGNLASDQAEDILQKIKSLNNQGITVIMVTHEQDIASHAKRVIRLKDGLVVSDERSQPIGNLPQLQKTQGLIRGRPFLFEMLEFFRSAFVGLVSNKVRSALSILGILIGVAAVITMLAMGRGAQKTIETRLAGLGSNLLMLRPGSPSSRGVQGASGDTSRLTLDDVRAISKLGGGIKYVDGNVSGSAQVVFGDKNVRTDVTGSFPVYEHMRASKPYLGRFFTLNENIQQDRVALLGQTVINKLFGDRNPIGQTIKINRVNFLVIGVLPLKGSGGFRDQDDVVIIPLYTAMNRVLGRDYLNTISIECESADVMAEITQSIRDLMRRRHRLPDYKEDDFDIRNMADIQSTLSATTKIFSALLGIVAGISLLVGGIGIMNIMLVSVSERTREIGLRKAVGATRRAIRTQFLIESAALSTFGGLVGVVVGGLISLLLARFAGWAADVTLGAVMTAFLFSSGVGILFGFWPANRAAKLSPIEALRYE